MNGEDATSASGTATDEELEDDTLLPAVPSFQELFEPDPDSLEKGRWRRLPHLIAISAALVWAGARGRAVAAGLLVGVGSALVAPQLVATNHLLQQVLEVRASGGPVRPLAMDFAIVGALAITMAVLTTCGQAQDTVVAEMVGRHVSERIAAAVSDVPLVTFEEAEFYNLLQRASQSGQMRPRVIIQASVHIVAAFVGGLGAIVALAAIEPALSLIAVLAAVPVFVATVKTSQRRFLMFVENTPDERERSTVRGLLATRDSAKEVRMFNLVPYLQHRADVVSERILGRVRREAADNARRVLLGRGASGAGKAVGYALLLVLVAGEGVSIAAAMTAMLAMQQLHARIGTFFTFVGMLHESALYLDDFGRLMDLAEGHRSVTARTPKESSITPFESLRTESASFWYPGKATPALSGVDFEIHRGEVVALVGENGSGKTTLAKVLCSLYEPNEGRVLWDGTDVSSLDPAAVRDHVTVIFQDFVRYALPARENVGLGRHERLHDDAALRGAADLAGVSNLFDKLPSGWDTVLSRMFAGGQELSGGQWQRVALARAFFRDAPFLVLDEPTAALDARAEHRLFERLRTLAASRTVLLITHRFANVRMADRIYVLHHGRIEDHGTHGELMSRGGRYAELFRLQADALLGGLATSTPGEVVHPSSVH